MSDSAPIQTSFTRDELGLLSNALNEILNGPEAIAEPEFGTRTGATVSEAQALLAKIGKLYKKS